MTVALALAAAALRAGLALRRAKRGAPVATGSTGGRRALLLRHLRYAKPAVLLLVVGFALGPISMVWLRDRAPFATLHAALGGIAGALFVAAAWLGHRIEEGRGGSADTHALLGVVALLFGGAAAVAGFVLLP
jgi:hypothetical protein